MVLATSKDFWGVKWLENLGSSMVLAVLGRSNEERFCWRWSVKKSFSLPRETLKDFLKAINKFFCQASHGAE